MFWNTDYCLSHKERNRFFYTVLKNFCLRVRDMRA